MGVFDFLPGVLVGVLVVTMVGAVTVVMLDDNHTVGPWVGFVVGIAPSLIAPLFGHTIGALIMAMVGGALLGLGLGQKAIKKKAKFVVYLENGGDGSARVFFFKSRASAEQYAAPDDERFAEDISAKELEFDEQGDLLTPEPIRDDE